MNKLDAIVLAGDTAHSAPLGSGNKCLLRIGGRPMLDFVLQALEEAGSVGDVYVVGPRAEVAQVLNSAARVKRFTMVEQGNTLVENVRRGFAKRREIGEQAEAQHGAGNESGATPHAFVLSGDMPLLTGFELDRFAAQSGYEEVDCVLAFASERGLARFYPYGLRPNYIFLRQFTGRINNMLIANLDAVNNLHYVDETYRLRYQKNLFTYLKYVWRVLLSDLDRPKLLMASLLPEICLQLQRLGLVGAARYLSRFNDKEYFERVIGAIFNIKFRMICIEGAVGALDIDSREELEIFREHFDELAGLAAEIGAEVGVGSATPGSALR